MTGQEAPTRTIRVAHSPDSDDAFMFYGEDLAGNIRACLASSTPTGMATLHGHKSDTAVQ